MKILIAILAIGLITQVAMGATEIPEPIYGSVIPNEGVTYVSKPATYIYQVDVEKLKENSKSQDPLHLQIYNPETNQWLNTRINTAINGSIDHDGVIDYRVDLAKLSTPFLGLSKFRFVDSKGNALKDVMNGEAIEFIGPKITANFRNESYKRDEAGTNSFSVWVRSYDTIYVCLCGRQSEEDNCEWFGPSIKSTSRGWVRLEWINVPYYRIVEFKIQDKPNGIRVDRYSFKIKNKVAKSTFNLAWNQGLTQTSPPCPPLPPQPRPGKP